MTLQKHSRHLITSSTLALFAALSFGGSSAFAAVSAVTLAPTIANYSGDCPAPLKFTGSITVTAPTIVSYVFTRSDGATDTVTKHLKFLAAGTKKVSTSWTLGGPTLPSYSGWQGVKVLSPNVMESAHANFTVACDPPLNSAKAAHGNTDWHIDTANEFLFGKDMNGNNTAANFAPASWTKTHIHTGLTNAARYYNDKSVAAGGEDEDVSKGIDKPMLFFYAGHGNATTWNTLGDNGHQTNTLLANLTGKGQLRYYWQCSCEVFAHGPLVSGDYSEPENFDGSADSGAMRNVFERWGPAIGKDLRMACGVSTLAYCHESNVNAIWNNFNNNGMSVADSFIDGLGSDSVKPLCITRGGSNITKTPLYDEAFTNRRNSSGTGYLHILYAGGTQTQPPVFKWKPELIPLKLWKVIVVPPGDPIEFKQRVMNIRGVEQIRMPMLAEGIATITRNPESGAVHLRTNAQAGVKMLSNRRISINREPQQAAMQFARQLGWMKDEPVTIRTQKLLTASTPDNGKRGAITKGEKGTLVSISRRIRNGDAIIDTVGRGGRIDIMLGSKGEITRASRTWRDLKMETAQIAIKPFEQAQAEAIRQLKEQSSDYKLGDWRFGYKEESASVAQRELTPVYEFDFVPADRKTLLETPPRRVEISAAQPQ